MKRSRLTPYPDVMNKTPVSRVDVDRNAHIVTDILTHIKYILIIIELTTTRAGKLYRTEITPSTLIPANKFKMLNYHKFTPPSF